MSELNQQSGRHPDWSAADYAALLRAHQQLEHPSFLARLTGRLGSPLEKFLRNLPDSWTGNLQSTLEASLERALELAIFSLGREASPRRRRRDLYHKTAGAVAGAFSGLFGLPAVLAELPVTSALMLRSIAAIARDEGEDLDDPDTRIACMEVFALGGRTREDDAAELGYYGVRVALGLHLTRVPERVLSQGVVKWSPPGLVRFIAEIAARFGVVVTEKAAVQMVPILGAGTGGLINLAFMEHFQDIARAHFTIRRLERRYGQERLQAEYARLSGSLQTLP